jgi:hypothetical protein
VKKETLLRYCFDLALILVSYYFRINWRGDRVSHLFLVISICSDCVYTANIGEDAVPLKLYWHQ